ncbi:M10 family metallopeptidase C-terminal domain-containing protein [Maliponia aquimaris]|uniref:Serralysin C n=1 Tax=Maliponia aquimaris TaxID=1673631 RepID=A0A238KQH3_9RHOB|nr:M10 family metallopeptidase C-terminal domain-containing protein [Maliponia aquimaris]SMX45094.1 Serralysin C precursor [Maliponia aquimaris]
MCFLCQSLDPKIQIHDMHGLSGELAGTTGGGTSSTSLPTFTLDQVALQLTHGYWQSTSRDWRAFDVQAGGTLSVNLSGLDPTGQAAAMAALAAWTAVSGLVFQVTTGGADITFDDNESGAYSSSWVYSSWNMISSSTVNVHPSWQGYGDYYHQTYIHEIGHALGLGHGGNYNGGASFSSNAHYANDSWQTSIMSYFSQSENPYTNASYNYLATPMMADILAIQTLYGTPTNVNTGNTVYGDNTTLTRLGMDLSRAWAVTIFDSAGIDTIDLGSRSYNQRLSLMAESFSDINGEIGNFAIARGAVIENAVTGSGNDEVTGNSAANHIQTGEGSDTLSGGEGNDTLDAGGGEDLLVVAGAPTDYAYFFDSADSSVLITDINLTDGSDQGTDRLIGIETLHFVDGYYGEVETDGAIKTLRVHVAGQALTSYLIQMDVLNSYDWTTIERTFESGRWDTQTNVYDNGRILEIDFTAGVRTSATMTDGADIYAWEHYTDRYDMSGARLSNATTWDGGRTVETFYTDGLRSSTLVTDGGNVYAWHSIERVYDTSGVLTRQVNLYDTGTVQEIGYTNGQRSTMTMSDLGNTATWTSCTDSFDSTGARTGREMVYDDGREVQTTYSGGRMVTSILIDGADEFVWHATTRGWDSSGRLDYQTTSYDDGRLHEIDFVNGVRNSSVLTDTADAYLWQSTTETHNSAGTLVERVTVWDNGHETVATFAGDAPMM